MMNFDNVIPSVCTCDDEGFASATKVVEWLRINFGKRHLAKMNLQTLGCFSFLLIPIAFFNQGLVIAITLLLLIILGICLYAYISAIDYLEVNLKHFDVNVKSMTINKPIANIKNMLMSFYIMQLLNKAGFLGMFIGIIVLAIVFTSNGA